MKTTGDVVLSVDGVTTADYEDKSPMLAEGHIALQQHNPKTVVEFRKIEIRELNVTAGGTSGLPAVPPQK